MDLTSYFYFLNLDTIVVYISDTINALYNLLENSQRYFFYNRLLECRITCFYLFLKGEHSLAIL